MSASILNPSAFKQNWSAVGNGNKKKRGRSVSTFGDDLIFFVSLEKNESVLIR